VTESASCVAGRALRQVACGDIRAPNCRFVADFIGETNFVDYAIEEFATVETAARMRFVGRIEHAPGQRPAMGAAATLSIRPEKMVLAEKRPDTTANAYEVRVISVGYVGSDTRVVVSLGDARVDVWEQNSVSTLDPNYFFRPGESAWLTFKPDNGLVLTA
jgi:spermidine/putrescine transport system ATP-binding protein